MNSLDGEFQDLLYGWGLGELSDVHPTQITFIGIAIFTFPYVCLCEKINARKLYHKDHFILLSKSFSNISNVLP